MMPKMMKPLSLAFLGALIAMPAAAQQANVVSACGSMAPFGPLVAGGQTFPTVDVNGNLCLSGGGGGGGGGGITSITAGTTPTTGFTAGQLLMSDGTVTQEHLGEFGTQFRLLQGGMLVSSPPWLGCRRLIIWAAH